MGGVRPIRCGLQGHGGRRHEQGRPATCKVRSPGVLADRFRLQYHRADKPLPVTDLRVGKHGLKLTPSNSSTPSGSYGPTFVKAEAWSIAQLASAISGLTGERIVEQTGATGRFEFDLQWKLEEQDAGVPPGAVVKRAALPDVLFWPTF